MSAFTDRLDRFVRWFFNSSPTAEVDLEPARPQPEVVPLRSPAPRAGRERPRRTTGDRKSPLRELSGHRGEPRVAGRPSHRNGRRADA
jgi:hypothetical protein